MLLWDETKEKASGGRFLFRVGAGAKKALDSVNRQGAPSAWLARASAGGQSGARTAPAPTPARGRAQDTRK